MPKILFVEDEPDHIALYKTKLEAEGFDFISATNSNEAFQMIEKETPDLVLLDILLPGESGLDILEKLKKNAKTKNIPTIIFTNFNEADFKARASKLEANDFVLKVDVTPQEMADKIRAILQK